MTKIDFPGFPGLDFGILKFHDFPGFSGPVRTLIYECRLVGLFHIYANNGHISEIYFYRPPYFVKKSVDMLYEYM
jgi:hypothetical protein